jgi:hypothetical protein
MIKVSKSGPEERWGKNEHHFHFKCAKGGLDENVRDVNQLLAIREALRFFWRFVCSVYARSAGLLLFSDVTFFSVRWGPNKIRYCGPGCQIVWSVIVCTKIEWLFLNRLKLVDNGKDSEEAHAYRMQAPPPPASGELPQS